MSHPKTFEEWLELRGDGFSVGSPYRSWNVRALHLKMYVRCQAVWYDSLVENRGDICIANITAYPMGRGYMTMFLEQYEPLFEIFFEQVINPRLEEYLKRRGYVLFAEYPGCRDFIKRHSNEKV